jgi:hypothetical protein
MWKGEAVPNNLYLVFSQPPDDLSAEEYDRWYRHHARENLESPGMVASQRYRVTPIIAGTRTAPGQFSGSLDQFGSKHLALYEYNGDIASLRRHLLARVESGNVLLPEWYDRVSFLTWNCEPVGERFEAPR